MVNILFQAARNNICDADIFKGIFSIFYIWASLVTYPYTDNINVGQVNFESKHVLAQIVKVWVGVERSKSLPQFMLRSLTNLDRLSQRMIFR